jgi:hypothetical protein
MPWKTTFQVLLVISIAIFSLSFVLAQTDEPADNGTIVIDVDDAAEGVIKVAETTTENLSSLLTDFINRLNTAPNSTIIQVLMVIGGVVLLVGGWRIYNWIIILAGAMIGGMTAMAAIGASNTVLTIAAFLVGALIGAALAVLLYYVAIFFIGGYIGIVFLSLVASTLGWATLPTWALLVALIIGGIIMLGISFEFLVVLASVVGAQLIVTALGLSPQGTWILILTLLGIFIQIFMMRRFGYNIRRRPARRLIWR